MKDAISTYGRTIMTAVICALLLIVLMSGIGLTGRIAGVFAGSGYGAGDTGSGPAAAMASSMEREIGDIEMRRPVKKNVSYSLDEIYSYSDSDMTQARILSVARADGFDITDRVCGDGEHIMFFEEGVYHLKISIRNQNGIRSMRKIYLGVTG